MWPDLIFQVTRLLPPLAPAPAARAAGTVVSLRLQEGTWLGGVGGRQGYEGHLACTLQAWLRTVGAQREGAPSNEHKNAEQASGALRGPSCSGKVPGVHV